MSRKAFAQRIFFLCPAQTMMCVKIHEMVAMKCEQYLAELSRYNYVTPKSYLELLKIFSDLIGRKKQELCGARLRMKTGLDKARPTPCPLTLLRFLPSHICPCGTLQLLSTAESVTKMQDEIEHMRPLLEKASREAVETMATIQVRRSLIRAKKQSSL